MSHENREIVRTSVAVVIAACLLKVAVVGVGWDDTTADTTAHPVSGRDTLDLAPATKSCGDFPLPGVSGSVPIKVEVVEGDIPCRVAQRVMKDQYREEPTGLWGCLGLEVGTTAGLIACVKNGGAEGAIRGRLYCRYWGPLRSRCLNMFGPP